MKKLLRRLHLYLGIFFAPLLLLFVVTGWWQTVTINRNKGLGFGQTLMEKLSTVHIDQYYPVEGALKYKTALFKALTVALSIGLIATVLLGVWIGLQTPGQRLGSLVALILGIALPALILYLGTRRTPGRAYAPASASYANAPGKD